MLTKTEWLRNTGRRNLGLCPDHETHNLFDQLKGRRKATETFASMVRLVADMVKLGRAGWSFQAVAPDGTVIEFDLDATVDADADIASA